MLSSQSEAIHENKNRSIVLGNRIAFEGFYHRADAAAAVAERIWLNYAKEKKLLWKQNFNNFVFNHKVRGVCKVVKHIKDGDCLIWCPLKVHKK